MEVSVRILPNGPIARGEAKYDSEAVAHALAAAALYLVGEIKKATPVGATGDLRSSIKAHPISSIGEQLVESIDTDTAYGTIVEGGARPHFPPSESLELWVQRKLGISDEKDIRSVAFLVARKISRKGTSSRGVRPGETGGQGYFMFEDALQNNLDHLNETWFNPLGLELVKGLET